MENQHVMTSPVTRPAAMVIPAADTYRVAGHRPTIQAATSHPFRIAGPVRESFARAAICAVSFRAASPRRNPAVRPARFLAAGACPDIAFTSERVDQADGHWPVRWCCRYAGRTGHVELAGQGPRLVAGKWPRAHGLFSAGGGGR
jgi:hypothetical protein